MITTEGMRRIGIVAWREIRERARTRAFQLSTLAALLAILAVIVIPAQLSGGTTTYRVGLTGTGATQINRVLLAQPPAPGTRVEARSYDTLAAGEQALRNRDVDVLVVDGAALEWRQRPDTAVATLAGTAVRTTTIRARAAEAGLSEQQAAALLAPIVLADRRLAAGSGLGENASDVALVAAVLVFVCVSIYGSTVLTGVAQDKTSRVAEVLLARIRPRELLTGKVLGIGALGLGQFGLVAVTAGVAARVVDVADVPQIPADLLVWLVIWFVLGYALYSVVYAALGAVSTGVEDAGAVAAPLSVLMFACYFATLTSLDSPESTRTTILSFLPPTAPFVMPLRLTLVAVPAWQVATSALLTAATVWLLLLVAARIYSGALLRTGGRVPLRLAWHGGAGAP